MKQPTRRKPISISTTPYNNGQATAVALCDDGTVWAIDVQHGLSNTKPWKQLPSIPQDFDGAEPINFD